MPTTRGLVGVYTRLEVLKRLAISRHQLYYALAHMPFVETPWGPQAPRAVQWGLYDWLVVDALQAWLMARAVLKTPEWVRYLSNRGRSEAAARRWLQRHPGVHPSRAPGPRRRG